MKRDHSETQPYAPSFNISGVDLIIKQLEPSNLNFYVLHLKERTKLPDTTFLVIDGKKRVPLFKKRFDTVSHYDYTYRVFETHTLRIESEYVLDIFVELDEGNNFVPKFDMTLFWTKRFQARFVSLPFFPPDLNLEQLALTNIDLKTIPPKTSIALKQRGDVSGTKASTLMGFYVPTVEEDKNWSFDAPKVFTTAQKKRMNKGAMNEEVAILFYLSMFQNICYKQIGWCRVPQPLPLNWGALPDGYIVDTNAFVPKEIQNWYPNLDPTQGVMEVKCTDKTSLTFEPYFYPQVYMEMISANVMWCDVIRFSKLLTKTPSSKWKTEYSARVYRIYRHKPTEQLLIVLLKYALKHKTNLQKIVHEDERFVTFRNFFEELASSEPFKALSNTDTFLDMMKDYENYKKQIY